MVELLKTQLMERKTDYPIETQKERTELERIASEFGDIVKYTRVNPDLEDIEGNEFTYGTELEFLYYRDDGTWITGWNEVGQNNRTIEYWVDKRKLLKYLSHLSKSENKFIKNLVAILKEISGAFSDDELKGEKSFVGRNIKVDNYNDLPELIRIHSKLRERLEDKKESV